MNPCYALVPTDGPIPVDAPDFLRHACVVFEARDNGLHVLRGNAGLVRALNRVPATSTRCR
jgi:hypothetical protein